MKNILSTIADNTGILSYMLNKSAINSGLILMYHRIIEPCETNQLLEPGMYVTPKTLESHILYLKNYYKISTFKEFVSRYKEDVKMNMRPFCVLTFDDGWYDFYKNVYPLIKKYKIPATVFLPTSFIGTENWFWTDRLAHLISKCGETILLDAMRSGIRNPLARQVNQLRGSPHTRLNKAIRILKSFSNESIEKTLSDLSMIWGITSNPPGRAFLSWGEVEELFQSGFVEFGSHTASHQILPGLDDESIKYELDSSKNELISKRVIDPDFIPFCYPNGSMDKRIVKKVREVGYGAAVTTMPGWNSHRADQFILNRVGIHQDMTSNSAMFGCRIAGLI